MNGTLIKIVYVYHDIFRIKFPKATLVLLYDFVNKQFPSSLKSSAKLLLKARTKWWKNVNQLAQFDTAHAASAASSNFTYSALVYWCAVD